MKTKQEIQLELLQEVDEICSQNNLKYIFAGISALNAYLNHTIKKDNRLVSLAMTQGDIDRFCEIVEKENRKDRYVEGIFNNPNYLPLYVTYGNENTAEFHMIARNKNKHHGINIRIYPIRKTVALDGKRIVGYTPRLSKEKKVREFMNKTIENKKFWFVKGSLKAINGAYELTGGSKRYYNKLKNNTFIDKWEDIQNYSRVAFINKGIESHILKEIGRLEFDGISLCVPKDIDAYFTEVYGEDFKERKIKPKGQSMRVILDTEVSYKEIMGEVGDLIKEAKATREEVMWGRLKAYNEKVAIDNVWKLVKMTDRQLFLRDMFKEKTDELLKYDLNNEMELEELYEELSPAIGSLRRYSKIGMTFSIDPKTDDLIERVLIKRGDKKLVDEIKKLKKKEYFVE